MENLSRSLPTSNLYPPPETPTEAYLEPVGLRQSAPSQYPIPTQNNGPPILQRRQHSDIVDGHAPRQVSFDESNGVIPASSSNSGFPKSPSYNRGYPIGNIPDQSNLTSSPPGNRNHPGNQNHPLNSRPSSNHSNPRSPGIRVNATDDGTNTPAMRDHAYEELPHRYPNPQYNTSTQSRPLPVPVPASIHKTPAPVTGSAENLYHSSGGSTGQPAPTTYRKRQNPLYEDPEIYDSLKAEPRSPLNCCDCPCWLVLLVGFVAFLALFLVILVVAGAVETNDSSGPIYGELSGNVSELELALRKIDDLERKYEALLNTVNGLSILSGNNGNYTLSQLEDYGILEKRVNSLQEGYDDLTNEIENNQASIVAMDMKLNQYNTSTMNQIANIELKQGPRGYNGSQGPAGAGDLSLCRHNDYQSGSSPLSPVTETPWLQHKDDVLDWIVTGVECSSINALNSVLKQRTHPEYTSVQQFQCICSGSSDSTSNRYCIIHVWECPKVS